MLVYCYTRANQYKHTQTHTNDTPMHTFRTQTCVHNRCTHRSMVVFQCVFHCRSVFVLHMNIHSSTRASPNGTSHKPHPNIHNMQCFPRRRCRGKPFECSRDIRRSTNNTRCNHVLTITSTNTFDSCTCNGHKPINVRTYTVGVMYVSSDTTTHVIRWGLDLVSCVNFVNFMYCSRHIGYFVRVQTCNEHMKTGFFFFTKNGPESTTPESTTLNTYKEYIYIYTHICMYTCIYIYTYMCIHEENTI